MEKSIFTFQEVSSSHLYWMRLTGYLPFEGKTYDYIYTKMLSALFHVSMFFYFTFWFGYGVGMLMRGSIEVDYVSEILTVTSIVLRYITLHVQREKVLELVKQCESIWSIIKPHESKAVRMFERKGYFLRTAILINSIFVAGIFVVKSIVSQVAAMKEAAALNMTYERTYIFRSPVEVTTNPWYSMIYTIHLMIGFDAPFTVASIETAALYLIMMICGYVRVVRDRLEMIREMQNDKSLSEVQGKKIYLDEVYAQVLECAKFHQKIVAFYENVESLTRKVYFIQVFTTVYNMSIAALKIAQKDDAIVDFIAVFLLNFGTFFLCQWAPEQLLNESDELRRAVYDATLESPDYKRETNWVLLMMMIKTKEPLQLTAGGYVNLSIETFGAMAKSAFSFFTLLGSFKE